LGNLANGFRAVDGIQPIKLPDSIGVMDLQIRSNWTDPSMNGIGDQIININAFIDNPEEVSATTAFSIIFSPAGKLVIHVVTVRNRGGDYRPNTPQLSKYDDIFNSTYNIINNDLGMFVQDDYAEMGYGSEFSRNRLYIYETKKFKQARDIGNPWDGYLLRVSQKPIYINPYTGTLIEQ
jgi:hypothetical protein